MGEMSTRSDMIDTVEGILLDEERGDFGPNVQRRWLAEVIVEAVGTSSGRDPYYDGHYGEEGPPV